MASLSLAELQSQLPKASGGEGGEKESTQESPKREEDRIGIGFLRRRRLGSGQTYKGTASTERRQAGRASGIGRKAKRVRRGRERQRRWDSGGSRNQSRPHCAALVRALKPGMQSE